MADPSKKYIFLVFFLQIAALVLEVLTLKNNTLWYCDHTALVPTIARNSTTRDVRIALKVRTSVDERCWYAVQIDEPTNVNDTLISKPVTECLLRGWVGLNRATTTVIDESDSGMNAKLFCFF